MLDYAQPIIVGFLLGLTARLPAFAFRAISGALSVGLGD